MCDNESSFMDARGAAASSVRIMGGSLWQDIYQQRLTRQRLGTFSLTLKISLG